MSVQPAAAATAAAQSVWEGMRTLGGLAVSAARSRIGSAGGSGVGVGVGAGAGGVMGGVGGVGRFFSRSAPERSGHGSERGRRRDSMSGRNGSGVADGDDHGGASVNVNASGAGGAAEGVYVTVVDLKALLGGVKRRMGQAEMVVQWRVA